LRDGGPSPTLISMTGIGYVAKLCANSTPSGAIGRFEIRWARARHRDAGILRGTLVAADGTVLGATISRGNSKFHRGAARPPSSRNGWWPSRRANQATLPAGFGAVFVRTHGCSAPPGLFIGGVPRELFVIAFAVVVVQDTADVEMRTNARRESAASRSRRTTGSSRAGCA